MAVGKAAKAAGRINRTKQSQFPTNGGGQVRQCRQQEQTCKTKLISVEQGLHKGTPLLPEGAREVARASCPWVPRVRASVNAEPEPAPREGGGWPCDRARGLQCLFRVGDPSQTRKKAFGDLFMGRMPMPRGIDGRWRGRGCQIGISTGLARDHKCLSGITLAASPVRHGFC